MENFKRGYSYQKETLEWITCSSVMTLFAKIITDEKNFMILVYESLLDIIAEFPTLEYLYIVTDGKYKIDTNKDCLTFNRGSDFFVGVNPHYFKDFVKLNLHQLVSWPD